MVWFIPLKFIWYGMVENDSSEVWYGSARYLFFKRHEKCILIYVQKKEFSGICYIPEAFCYLDIIILSGYHFVHSYHLLHSYHLSVWLLF